MKDKLKILWNKISKGDNGGFDIRRFMFFVILTITFVYFLLYL